MHGLRLFDFYLTYLSDEDFEDLVTGSQSATESYSVYLATGMRIISSPNKMKSRNNTFYSEDVKVRDFTLIDDVDFSNLYQYCRNELLTYFKIWSDLDYFTGQPMQIDIDCFDDGYIDDIEYDKRYISIIYRKIVVAFFADAHDKFGMDLRLKKLNELASLYNSKISSIFNYAESQIGEDTYVR